MEWQTCVVLLCVTAVLAEDEWLEVKIAQGTVRGRKHPSGDLYAFYNIPYATTPIGVYKFKAPLPPPTWSEPLDATGEKKVVCPQNGYLIDYMPNAVEVKEDCLIANVFVPNTTEKNLSVFVYIHGGAYVTGFGDLYEATQFMKTKDFVMVTFNYRLGIHGFLCLGTEDIPGNAGMKDQVALLHWVQENIASFGGNPGDVTVGGSSAGASAADLLMLSKSAENLFHRVIPESGGNLAAFSIQRDPLEIAQTFARDHNFANVDDIDALELFYKTASWDLLTIEIFENRTDATFLFSPCVERDTDGAFLTESPLSILKKGNFKKLPLLYGFNNMEGLVRINYFETWKNKMNEKFSDFLPADLKFESDEEREEVANTIKKFYFGDKPVGNDNILKYIDFFSGVLFTLPMLWAVKLQVKAGNNQVYLYEYSFVDENVIPVPHTDNVRGAEHCAQSFAWLDDKNVRDSSLVTTEFLKMRMKVREIWHNFMKTGTPVPVGSSLPAWPAALANRSPHMSLNETLELRGILLEEQILFWEDIYEKHYLEPVPPQSGAGSTVRQNVFNLLTLFILLFLTKR